MRVNCAIGAFCVNPFRTAVPFWGQPSQILSTLSPKRDCGSKRVKTMKHPLLSYENVLLCPGCLILCGGGEIE